MFKLLKGFKRKNAISSIEKQRKKHILCFNTLVNLETVTKDKEFVKLVRFFLKKYFGINKNNTNQIIINKISDKISDKDFVLRIGEFLERIQMNMYSSEDRSKNELLLEYKDLFKVLVNYLTDEIHFIPKKKIYFVHKIWYYYLIKRIEVLLYKTEIFISNNNIAKVLIILKKIEKMYHQLPSPYQRIIGDDLQLIRTKAHNKIYLK